MGRTKKLPPPPMIAKMFLDAHEELWNCDNATDKELQEWAKTRTTTNCYAGEYAVAQHILTFRKKVRV